MINVLYIHGMGGGGDSRIPSILNEAFAGTEVNVVVRTYDFDPEIASVQIDAWFRELQPSLVIGESLGAVHAIRLSGVPHILISPSLNAPLYFHYLSWLALIPGVTWMMDRSYKPREGDRQSLHFTFDVMRKYGKHRKLALANSIRSGSRDEFYAFFGTHDHYRKSGIVSVSTWKKYFGYTFDTYEGTHFTEEEHIHARIVPLMCDILKISI